MKVTVNKTPKKGISVSDLKRGQFAVCVGHKSGLSTADGDIVFHSCYSGTYIIHSKDEYAIGGEFTNENYIFELIEPQEFIFNKE